MEEPEIGEIVVIKVKKVLNYGAFVELTEYDNRTGFIHISQVASRWVKNIRNYVKENQTRAAQVLSVDRAKNQIDLSLTKVSSQGARDRIEEWKQSKRAKKLIEVLAKSQKKKFEVAWKEVAEPLLEEHDSLYEAFQEISMNGEKATSGVGKTWIKSLVELAEKSVAVPLKTVSGIMEIKSESPEAIVHIRDSLKGALKQAKEAKLSIHYSGGGSYEIKSTALDFKTAEKDMNAARDFVIKALQKEKGTVEFTKTS